MESSVNIIAIDGPAASGKSTLGKLLAEQLSLALPYRVGFLYRIKMQLQTLRDRCRLMWRSLRKFVEMDMKCL